MVNVMRWSSLILPPLLLLVIQLCLLLAIINCSIVSAELTDTEIADQSLRGNQNYTFPKLLFDFNSFKVKFHKDYASALEAARRLKLFLARSFVSFQSMVRFKLNVTQSYSTVNSFSDRTEPELESLFLPIEQVERQFNDMDRLAVAEFDPDQLPPLRKDMGLKNFFGFGSGSSSSKSSSKKKKSYSSDDDEGSSSSYETSNSSEDGDTASTIYGSSHSSDGHQQTSPEHYHSYPADELYTDMRGCLPPPKNQLDCGACYTFALLGIYEYFFCRQHGGQIVSFSEQYIIDCGYRTRSGGCHGGHFVEANDFVNRYGVDLTSNYGYMNAWQDCRYSDRRGKKFDSTAAGLYRIQGQALPSSVAQHNFKSILRHGLPIYVSGNVWNVPEFMYYGGGVITPSYARGHGGAAGHALLLVGDGQENGQEYWLVRNSSGADWGLGGYVKINKKCQHCFHENRGFTVNSPYRFTFVDNYGYKMFGKYFRA